MVVTRFCPTPSGHLHHGNMYTAILNQEFARQYGGRFVVQIDDFFDRYPPRELVEAFLEDMEWLEICPREAVLFHSSNLPRYLAMMDELERDGKAKIRREQKGCCLSKVEICCDGEVLPVVDVRASGSHPGIGGYLTFAAHPRHVVDGNWTAILGEASNWRHDTFWASDPAQAEPWIEFDLPAGSRPDAVRLVYWHPKPEEIEVSIREKGGTWTRAAQAKYAPERIGEIRWAAYIPPRDDIPEVLRLEGEIGEVDRLRLSFKGMQQTESYEFRAPEGCETVRYRDLILGEREAKRTQAVNFLLFQFARAANEIVLGSTHIIRGDELEGELNFYAQCFYVLNKPRPVLCHIPHLVDDEGEKLSKSFDNADRIVMRLKEKGLSPAAARQWIVENAYSNIRRPGKLHSFEGQLNLLAESIEESPKPARARRDTNRFKYAG